MSRLLTHTAQFVGLSAVIKLVLVLLHSNADAELVFSLAGLNKTKARCSLALQGTLVSLMTIKMADLEPCFRWEPSQSMIKAANSTTTTYNTAHWELQTCFC